MQPAINEVDLIPLGNISMSWSFLDTALRTNGFHLVTKASVTDVAAWVKAGKKLVPLLLNSGGAPLPPEQEDFALLLRSRMVPYLLVAVLPNGSIGGVTIVVGSEQFIQDRMESALSVIRSFINIGIGLGENTSSEFFQGVSHEVRSFLNGISGPIQLLKDKIEAKDQYDLYSMIDSSIARLVRFTFKTSLIGLLQQQKYGVKQEIVNLYSLLQHATVDLQEIKFSGKVNVAVEPPSFEPTVLGDADLLLQCFESLMERIVLSYGNEAPLKVSFLSPERGRVSCKIAFVGLSKMEGEETIDEQLSRDFATDLGFLLAKQIIDIQAADFNYTVLANNQVEFLLVFKHHAV